jgi:hypothetical protein
MQASNNVGTTAWMASVLHLENKLVFVGDIPNRYTCNVVLNQQARVAHGGGMADSLPGGPVARRPLWQLP